MAATFRAPNSAPLEASTLADDLCSGPAARGRELATLSGALGGVQVAQVEDEMVATVSL